MNAQEIFDAVAKHLAAQGCQSLSPDGTCAYRGESGRKCAVGVLITDAEYKASMEGTGPTHDLMPAWFQKYGDLLWDLQAGHDDSTTGKELRRGLKRAAEKRDLSPAILDTLTFPAKWE